MGAESSQLHLPRWRIEPHESLPSTQELLKERLRAGTDVDGVVLRTVRQTAGLGRRGKSWSGLAGGSYQSVALRDQIGRLRRPWTSLAVAIGIAEELRSAGAQVRVKWPNDLFLASSSSDGGELAGRYPTTGAAASGKLGGVLSEHLRSHLVVGVGVNVANEVPNGASALTGWKIAGVNDLVLRGIKRGLEELVLASDSAQDGSSMLTARYAPFDILFGAHVVALTPQGQSAGVARGVDHCGLLVLEGANGTESVAAGTVLSWQRDEVIRP